jgi:hypothetical protein
MDRFEASEAEALRRQLQQIEARAARRLAGRKVRIREVAPQPHFCSRKHVSAEGLLVRRG